MVLIDYHWNKRNVSVQCILLLSFSKTASPGRFVASMNLVSRNEKDVSRNVNMNKIPEEEKTRQRAIVTPENEVFPDFIVKQPRAL